MIGPDGELLSHITPLAKVDCEVCQRACGAGQKGDARPPMTSRFDSMGKACRG